MSRKNENCAFLCTNCKKKVVPVSNGSYRNHCPFCLYSLHVDIDPGDRQNACNGLMEPVSIRSGKKGLQVIHRCKKCGISKPNKIAEYTIQPDNIEAIINIMKKNP